MRVSSVLSFGDAFSPGVFAEADGQDIPGNQFLAMPL
jgi:hypothetical protein